MRAPETLSISDHAVLRYLERRYGFDIEALRQEIREICGAPFAVGAIGIKKDGLYYPIVDGVVTSVVPDTRKGPKAETVRRMEGRNE